MATATTSTFTADETQKLRRRLRAWYRKHARDLPWRRTTDPYAIWVSEIMLQQTTVAAVIPYFHRFLVQFPNVRALAAAKEQQVLRLWEGLGYYRRARQLHAAARVIVDQHQGEFPSTPAAILALPGIGRYTAGAISSFAYNLPQPIVEANTARLYARLMALKLPLANPAAQKALWQLAAELVPARNPAEFNQALMELGATVCTPRDPDCRHCPLSTLCETQRRGWQAKIPAPAVKPRIEEVQETAIAVCANQHWLLVQRGAEERWAGMWDFPRVLVANQPTGAARGNDPQAALAHAAIRDELQDRFQLEVAAIDNFTTIRHAVTRFRITLRCLRAEAQRTSLAHPARWLTPARIQEIPLTTPARRIAAALGKQTA